MKKLILTVSLILVVVLSLVLVGCTSIRTIANDLGFSAEQVSELRFAKQEPDTTVTKLTNKPNKISLVMEKISTIEMDKFDGEIFESDWDETPSYAITFTVKGYEGNFEMRVVKKAPNTTVNESDKEIIIIGFRAMHGFNAKSGMDGFYTVADSQAFLDIMAEIDVNIMSA